MKLSILLSAPLLSFVDAVTLTTTTDSYTIDAESTNAFQFVVSRANCDITSLKYRGVEAQYQTTGSHIGSGLGSGTTVTAQEITSKTALLFFMRQILIGDFEQVALPNT